MGLVRSRPEGRIRRLELTKKGEIVALALSNLMKVLSRSGGEWKKMERLEAVALEAKGLTRQEATFKVGPLRRDLALLKGEDEDEDLSKAVEELDQRIVAIISG